MSEAVFTSPLAHRRDLERQPGLSVTLAEVSDRGVIDLRGQTDDTKFMAAAKSALGVALPVTPRTSATKDDVTVLWFSVDHWLVTLPRAETTKILKALQTKTKGQFASACDVSDARAIIRIAGDGVREVLMKGTSVDLTSPEISTGTVRRMLFAEVAAACHVVDEDAATLDLYVFRSNADYVWEWLLATARAGARVQLYGAQTAPPV